MDWQARGYSAGLRGLKPDLPEGIPPRMDQPFLKGHETGWKDYMAALEANMPKKLTVREQAAKDFAEDNPGAPTLAEERYAEKREERAVKEALENMATTNDEGFEATPEELAQQQGRRVSDEDGEVV